jgi:L-rhamnonate dehydratase
MKITDIRAMRCTPPPHTPPTPPRRQSWHYTAEVANPMSGYPRLKSHRSLWLPSMEEVWCQVTLEDGTVGLGQTIHGRMVAAVIDDHLGPRLTGQDALEVETLADMLQRLTKPYGTGGLASFAISAIDLALWDARGKLLGRPVYELLGGGRSREPMFCYATGNDVDWYQELGFKAFKLACPYGPADGWAGLRKNEAFVAQAREQIGPECDLMLDCWMAFDVDYAVRLAEVLRPYRLTWMEECLIPEDFDGHLALRERLPWQTLTTGEHWFTTAPFHWASAHRAVDILQPDLNWCGGVTVTQKIAAIAEAGGQKVILHGGGNGAFGQHFSYATRAVPWCEFFVASPPGVPLEEAGHWPGLALPKNGYLQPNDAPGFGLDIPAAWQTPYG